MISTRPNQQQLAFDFSDEVVSPDAVSELQPEQSSSAVTEKPALDSVSFDLMERIVDDGNMERAWKKVKANRGAPGPDGVTLDEFFETFRHQWLEFDNNSWKELIDRVPLGGKKFPNRMAACEISEFET